MSKKDTLIQCVNKLHDIFSKFGVNAQFDLPQIAVVGSQSAGKSSVLENFVGWDFLPRGSGIVTRCPLILQMLIGPEKYGKFSHSEKKFTDFDEIREEIEKRTSKLSGNEKGISKVPINLKIYSPEFLDLTLVDLPGLTRNPIGNQPADIEQQLEEMILEYIKKDSCLILAVSPANMDLANSDALKLARRVDPEGKRTIGVLTKLDIMDKGTNARDVILGKTHPLPRGYYGVVSRSQSDIDAGKDINEALKKEAAFFKNHKGYHDLDHRMGTPVLQRALHLDLAKHIREKLPEFREKILEKKKYAEKILKSGEKLELKNGGLNVLHKIVNQLHVKMTKCIRGTAEDIPMKQKLGAKIHTLFHEKLEEDYWAEEVDEEKVYKEITTAIKNLQGIQPNLYGSDQALTQVAKNQIMRKHDATEKCLERVVQELRLFLSEIVDEIVARCYPYRSFAAKVKDTMYCQLTSISDNCEQLLKQILLEESSYINTKHVEFLNSDKNPVDKVLQNGLLSYDGKIIHWSVLSWKNLSMYDASTSKGPPEVCHRDCQVVNLDEKNNRILLKSQVDSKSKNSVLETPNKAEFNAWKDAFITAGVMQTELQLDNDMKKEFQRIQEIRKHLALHMRIFAQKFLDTVPKKIVFHVVEGMIDYVNDHLFDDLGSLDNLIELLDENPEYKEIRKSANAELEACKRALEIIDEQDAKLAF